MSNSENGAALSSFGIEEVMLKTPGTIIDSFSVERG
jgi:hypothetical protein